eukprot:3036369-Pleurochrysis_carterae.AAC.2
MPSCAGAVRASFTCTTERHVLSVLLGQAIQTAYLITKQVARTADCQQVNVKVFCFCFQILAIVARCWGAMPSVWLRALNSMNCANTYAEDYVQSNAM